VVIREYDRRGPITQIQLGKQVIDMRFDSALTNVKVSRDLRVGQALTYQGQDFRSRTVSKSSAAWCWRSGGRRAAVDASTRTGHRGVEPSAAFGTMRTAF